MTSTFDRARDPDGDDFGRENEIDRNYGEPPVRGTRPKTINLSELARGGGGTGANGGGAGGGAGDTNLRGITSLAKNLTNRVPGISELLEADSEVVRELGRKPTTQFNPRFLEQQRAKKEACVNQVDDKQTYLNDRADREKRYEEREKLRVERYNKEMQQRANFYKQNAKTGEQVKTTLEDLNEAMVARTNQLGTMVEQLRADLLESQIEQQNLQKKLYTQTCNIESQVDRKMSWLLCAAFFAIIFLAIVIFIQYIWPLIREKFSSPKSVDVTSSATIVQEKPAQTITKIPTALDTDKDLSIEI